MANRGINKVILIGYLGQDPEVRYMPNGNSVTTVNLATTESWKDKNTDQIKEKTEWHRVVFFGKLAEISGEYLHKGSQIYIEGQLQNRKWKDQNNNEKYITEIIVGVGGTMQMLSNNKNTVNSENKNFSKINNEKSLFDNKEDTEIDKESNLIDFDEDIPF